MVLGLDIGSTTVFVVVKLDHILSTDQLSNIIGVPSSKRTKEQTCFLEIPLFASTPSNRVWKQPLAVSFTTTKPQLKFATIRALATEEKVEAAAHAAEKEEAPVGFTPPELDPNTPSSIFGGSTGSLLRKVQVEEFYVITWDSLKEQIFGIFTGGAAIMKQVQTC
ncbi:photosystem I reaction center subunit II, chloroplastic-like [Arachis stenosperma]|uniref:photosystem I reaction center subunit II, chloroplastic-like n=1 Tax=Arachis stenosperma TaxID=217475 RepID=UPI0025AD7BDC|nr:photosystem I reaction center subunit II, chloroplastic-like [Arachis stenosperma]